MNQNYFIWHHRKGGWLLHNAVDFTLDIEQAHRFTQDQAEAIKSTLNYVSAPGVSFYSVSDYFKPNGEPYHRWYLEINFQEYVLWGYGKRDSRFEGTYQACHLEPARIVLDLHGEPLEIPFELPQPKEGGLIPQEYQREMAWGWRFRDGGVGNTGWKLAPLKHFALRDAWEWARNHISKDGHKRPYLLLALKHDVRFFEQNRKMEQGETNG